MWEKMHDSKDLKIRELDEKYAKIEDEINELKDKLEKQRISEEKFANEKEKLNEKLNTLKNEITEIKNEKKINQVDINIILLEELKQLRDNFQVDFNTNIEDASKAKVYISSNPYDHFRFLLSFNKFPKKPNLVFSPEANELLHKSPEEISQTLKSWDKDHPGHFVDIFQEIESELLDRAGIEIGGEFSEAQKLAARRRSIKLAKESEENGEYKEAIWFLENAIKISKEFEETEKVIKYTKKVGKLKEKI
jgi:hypothetical protein